ncbi:MAG: ATP-binding protein [Bacteroidales bacterium]
MKRILSNRIHYILVPLLVLTALMIILSLEFKKHNQKPVIAEKFREDFQAGQKQLEKNFGLFYDRIDPTDKPSHIHDKATLPECCKDLHYFLFYGDSLIFWTQNTLIPDKKIFRQDSGYHIAFLKNGVFQCLHSTKGPYTFMLLSPVKYNYAYQNKFLPRSFASTYEVPPSVSISPSSGQFNIFDAHGNILFSLNFPDNVYLPLYQYNILFVLFLIIAVLSILLIHHLYFDTAILSCSNLVKLILFALDLIILRALLMIFSIPSIFQNYSLYNPSTYAHSWLIPSLADLLLTSMVIFAITYTFFSKIKIKPRIRKNNLLNYFKLFTIFFHFFIFFKLLHALIQSLIYNSGFPLDLTDVLILQPASYLSLFALSLLIMSYIFVSVKLFENAFHYLQHSRYLYFISAALSAGIFLLYAEWAGYEIITTVAPLLLIISMTLLMHHNKRLTSFYNIVFFLFYFSAITAYVFQKHNTRLEHQERRLIAIQLSQTFDPLTEYKYSLSKEDIQTDVNIVHLLQASFDDASYEDSLSAYLENNYLSGIFQGYSPFITVCTEDKILEIQPEEYLIDCNEYFTQMISQYTDTSGVRNLYRNNYFETFSYLLKIPFTLSHRGDTQHVNIYVELYYNNSPEEGLGYPQLLVDKGISQFPDISQYAYARYKNGELVYKSGPYYYSILLERYFPLESGDFFDRNNYEHFYYHCENGDEIIISKPKKGFFASISPFSYLFLFNSVILLVFLLIFVVPFKITSYSINLRSKFQIVIISVILFLFFLLGFLSISYIVHLNEEKNLDILKEKTHSVLIELEHKLASEPYLDNTMEAYLSELLNKFSLVFFSDINLYDLSGNLLATSRPKVFQAGLKSSLMDPAAFNKLSTDKKLLFIHREKIGNYPYLSAYIPFRNSQNTIVAYLNLPYFARQTELKSEISSFLTTFLNIYILFMALTLFLGLFISRYTTRPLKLLMDRMAKVTLERTNEKIYWKGKDEIGNLVNEYNRMVGELASSAEKLARSERESAWREMAKQVAHEVKNPLTPMKLSVQHLKKSWDEKDPGWEDRLNRFTKTIIDQIETLSSIASEFSYFAKMPAPVIRKIDLIPALKRSINLFSDIKNIDITLSYDSERSYSVNADDRQLTRIFNNIVSNSVQAIGSAAQGRITIDVQQAEHWIEIHISDNGPGIPGDVAGKIFSPSFTTKSSGMGLGLSIAKSMVQAFRGEITFTSVPGKGTTFYIRLPKAT